MVELENIDLGRKVKNALQGRTQRWLVLELIKRGIDMSDVKMSNRLQGIGKFTADEINLINSILNAKIEF